MLGMSSNTINKTVLGEFKEVRLIKTYADGACPVTYVEEDGRRNRKLNFLKVF